nr:hypothetical protein [Bradyrhizobium uaiense]
MRRVFWIAEKQSGNFRCRLSAIIPVPLELILQPFIGDVVLVLFERSDQQYGLDNSILRTLTAERIKGDCGIPDCCNSVSISGAGDGASNHRRDCAEKPRVRILVQGRQLVDHLRIFREIGREQLQHSVTRALGIAHSIEDVDPRAAGLGEPNERPRRAEILVQIRTEERLAEIGMNVELVVPGAVRATIGKLLIGAIQLLECCEQQVPLRFGIDSAIRINREQGRQAALSCRHEGEVGVLRNRIQIFRRDWAHDKFSASRQETTEAIAGTESRINRLRPIVEGTVELDNGSSSLADAGEYPNAHAGAGPDLIEILDDFGIVFEGFAKMDSRPRGRRIVA